MDEGPIDFVGSIRGFDVQLYSVNKEATKGLVHPKIIGEYLDRDTPALYSFGQLSPSALTFTPISTEFFSERKTNILKAFDKAGMDSISKKAAKASISQAKNSRTIEMKEVVGAWTREVTGEFVWGKKAMNEQVGYKDKEGNVLKVPFMLALNETFTRLRFYSNRFWNRVYFPAATWPITQESLLLKYNIKSLQKHLASAIENTAENSVSYTVLRSNRAVGIPDEVTRDDLLTVSIAGLDTVQSTILATLWYVLLPENKKWRDRIVESNDVEKDRIVEACINEAIRLEPPGSVINNKVVKDFSMDVLNKSYSFKSGTRLMPNIHALHAVYGKEFQPERFLSNANKSDLYVMPFGRGRRSCPGRTIGTLMAKNYISEFISSHPKATIINLDDEHIHFNNLSISKLILSLPTGEEPVTNREGQVYSTL